jgi:L-fuconolactonase
MRIDAHQHFWRYDPVRYPWITDAMPVLKRDYMPGDLAPELARNGLDASIAVQAEQSEGETEFLLDLAQKHSFIAGVVGWVDLRSPTVAERLRYFSQYERLVGFRHIAQDEADDFFLLGQEFLRGLRELQPFGFTYASSRRPWNWSGACRSRHSCSTTSPSLIFAGGRARDGGD